MGTTQSLIDTENLYSITLFDIQSKQKEQKEQNDIWYKFLCQRPLYTNAIVSTEDMITTGVSVFRECDLRFINYLYDIKPTEDFLRNNSAKQIIFKVNEVIKNIWDNV